MFTQEPPSEATSKRVPANKQVIKLADEINRLADEVNSFYFPDAGEDFGGELGEAKEHFAYSMHKMHEALVALVWSGAELPRGKEPIENWSMFYSYKRCYETIQDIVGGFSPPLVAENVQQLQQRVDGLSEALSDDGISAGDLVVIAREGKRYERYVGSVLQIDTESSTKPLYQVEVNKAYDAPVDRVWLGADKLHRPKAADVEYLYGLMQERDKEAE